MAKVFGFKIEDISFSELLEKIRVCLATECGFHIVTANPEILLEAYNNPILADSLNGADIIVADGVGVLIASYVKGNTFNNSRITGVDLTIKLLNLAESEGINTLIIGGTSESAIQKATQNTLGKSSNHIYAYSHSSINAEDEGEIQRIVQLIRTNNAKIVLIALGHKKQEILISGLKKAALNCVMVGIGGTVDYLSGEIQRPSSHIRMLGLEWLVRLFYNPKLRAKRILRAVIFFPFTFLAQEFVSLFHVEQRRVDK